MSPRQSVSSRAFASGLLRLVRIQNLLLLLLTLLVARIFLIGPRAEWLGLLTEPAIWLLALSTVCIAAAGYIINDYFDVKIDLVNKPDRVIIGRYLKRRVAMGTHQILSLLGCLIGLYVSRWVFVADVVAVSLLWSYSAWLKRQPFIGNLVVSLLTALSLVVLAIYYRQQANLLLAYALFSFGISLVREIIKDMQDVRGDARFGCRTLPIIWGLRRTKYLLYGLIGAFIISLFFMADLVGSRRLGWVFVALLVPVAWLTYRLVLADTRRDFGYLSNLCKLIMLMGVFSMVWA